NRLQMGENVVWFVIMNFVIKFFKVFAMTEFKLIFFDLGSIDKKELSRSALFSLWSATSDLLNYVVYVRSFNCISFIIHTTSIIFHVVKPSVISFTCFSKKKYCSGNTSIWFKHSTGHCNHSF